ncbi:hypothetical protein [Streptomyces eurythermus]|uniref:hypothetical protein n=1 Tax=Streptomyces eurythermus TaxID=42237 RepID=UPI0036FFBE37
MATHRSDSDRPRQGREPRLKVGAPAVAPARRSLARRLLPRAVAAGTALCAIVVLVQGHAALPFERIVTIQAKMASKADFFEDPEVRRLLVRHGYRVRLTRMGSRGIATQRCDGYDIVSPTAPSSASRPAPDRPPRCRSARQGSSSWSPAGSRGGGSRGETLLMRAPYADGGPTAHLRVVLRGDGLLTPDKELPEGQLQAHCLGKVTSWDPDAREVVLQYPVAVFR